MLFLCFSILIVVRRGVLEPRWQVSCSRLAASLMCPMTRKTGKLDFSHRHRVSWTHVISRSRHLLCTIGCVHQRRREQ